MNVRIEEGWKKVLAPEFDKFYFETLTDFVRKQYQQGAAYPPAGLIFRAFDCCPFDRVRVVILGQDPYHEPGQAEGLAFSVPEGITPPPSLRNILQEIASDLGRPSIIRGGHLMPWVEQGVLLLNATLTVEAHKAASHQGHGWETFTDAVITSLNQSDHPIVFVLWGKPAQSKEKLITNPNHLILKAPHPSPLSSYRGFFGSKPFSQINEFLKKTGQQPIDWRVE